MTKKNADYEMVFQCDGCEETKIPVSGVNEEELNLLMLICERSRDLSSGGPTCILVDKDNNRVDGCAFFQKDGKIAGFEYVEGGIK